MSEAPPPEPGGDEKCETVDAESEIPASASVSVDSEPKTEVGLSPFPTTPEPPSGPAKTAVAADDSDEPRAVGSSIGNVTVYLSSEVPPAAPSEMSGSSDIAASWSCCFDCFQADADDAAAAAAKESPAGSRAASECFRVYGGLFQCGARGGLARGLGAAAKVGRPGSRGEV